MLNFAVFRIFGAFAVAYLLPAILRQRRRAEPGEWWLHLVQGFVLTAAAVEILALSLAGLGLRYAGAVMGLWLVILVGAAFGVRFSQLGPMLLNLVRRIESGPERQPLRGQWKSYGTASLAGAAMVAAVFVQRAWFSLNNWRFTTLEGYERTFSLFQITSSGAAIGNGSLPLLVPLSMIGSLDAASTIRFADPLFATLVCVAAALFAYSLSGRRPAAAILALAFTAVLPAVAQDYITMPSAAQQMATAFWLLAGLLAYDRRFGGALGAVITAGLTGGVPTMFAGLAAVCVVLAWAIDRASQPAPRWIAVPARALLVCLAAGRLIADLGRPVPDGPYQYEAAAVAAESIAQTFPRGQWFIVSPTHELTSVLGRGWHIELLDFLKQYDEQAVAPPDFKFPWDANVFIFAERQALTQPNSHGGFYHGGQGMAMIGEDSILAYGTPLGRADTQFRLARVIATYARNHDNVSVYYQDDKLTVYRISRTSVPVAARFSSEHGEVSREEQQ